MGKLTTHVLDTANGKPGSGISVKVYRVEDDRRLVASTTTNDNGRTEEALLEGETFRLGTYEMEFCVGNYFSGVSSQAHAPPFLDAVVVRVTLSEDEHYHVPLLVSPWSYSTYRGS